MKKKYLQVLSLFLAVSMMSGCGSETRTLTFSNNENSEVNETTESQVEENEIASSKDSSYIEHLRAKFGKSDPKYDYNEPMYNLPKDHTFVFENVCEDAFEGSLMYDSLRVFADAELQNEVYTDVEEDFDNGILKLKPWKVFSLEDENNGVDDGTWGSRSKFYLVQYKDFTTNKAYEKPRVTVFTIARDLDTPTLEQSISDMGDYELTWNPINGADYYEVYRYEAESDFAYLVCKTKETNCKEELYSLHNHESDDEDGRITSQNLSLLLGDAFVVVAKTENGKISGMSNTCNVKDIAYTIPTYTYSHETQEEFEEEHFCEGSSAMVLPTHMSVRMLDDSVTKELLDYENAEIEDIGELLEVRAKFVNLKMEPTSIYFSGMSEQELREDLKNVVERQKELEKKTARKSVEINVPYTPTSDTGNTQKEDEKKVEQEDKKSEDDKKSGEDDKKAEDEDKKSEEDDKKTEDEDKKSEDDDKKTEDEDKKSEDDDKKTEDEDKKSKEDNQKSEDDNKKEEKDKPKKNNTNIEDTVYANSALSAHIAINMLENEEEISLEDFPESSDRDFLLECILEAYNQNPLIGIMEDVSYDYTTNCLVVEYALNKDESIRKRDAAIEKAQEITDRIITDDMNDFEKEEAINTYLCENGSYDESIYDYIQEDGSISDDVLDKTVDSFLPYGILVNNVGVCESYAEAFLLLARNAGLDAVIETGRMDGIAHEWNRVKIDDEWYVMDVTNNDNDKAPNAYFNLSDAISNQFLIPDRNAIAYDVYDNYAAVSDDKEFYLIKGKCAAGREEAVEMMGNLLHDENMATIRVNEELDESDVEKIVRNVAENKGLTDGSYFYYRGLLSMTKR